jgi:hypothetical protein
LVRGCSNHRSTWHRSTWTSKTNEGDDRSRAAVPEAGDRPGPTGAADLSFDADQEDTLVNPDFSTTDGG